MTARSPVVKSVTIILLCLLLISTASQWYFVVNDYEAETEAWEVLPENALATRLRASEIMSRPIATGQDMYSMPRYIHQSWMTDTLPSRLSHWSQSCRAQHRHWSWILWTDEDNLKMVEIYFPWFLETYNALPAAINRADVARNMYMYMFGGVYADLDTECLQPMEGLFREHGVRVTDDSSTHLYNQVRNNSSRSHVAFFGRITFDGRNHILPHTIPNAWMAASPGHPFFLLVLEKLQAAVASAKKANSHFENAESLTGPVALYDAITEYKTLVDDGISFDAHFAGNPSYRWFNRNSVQVRMEILPPEYVYPHSWNQVQTRLETFYCSATKGSFNSKKCKELVTTEHSYAITYWSHTWNKDLSKTHDSWNMKQNED